MLDIAHDVSARLEHNFAAANGPLDPPITTTRSASTPPWMAAFGEMNREVQCTSPST